VLLVWVSIGFKKVQKGYRNIPNDRYLMIYFFGINWFGEGLEPIQPKTLSAKNCKHTSGLCVIVFVKQGEYLVKPVNT